ncbi:MAG: DUF3344 domain-containing protein, partial [Methanomicrobiales archaeon]|nr:DUF3344 domain-containing protein [Methanomicrobiales archaeon]
MRRIILLVAVVLAAMVPAVLASDECMVERIDPPPDAPPALTARQDPGALEYAFVLRWGMEAYTEDGDFDTPSGIAVDAIGNIYVADRLNWRIQKFDGAGNFLTKWGSPGSEDGEFQQPAGVTVDTTGNVYVVDEFNYRIQKFDSNGNFLTKWGSQGSGDGEFQRPEGITTDTAGDIYVVDASNCRIQKFDDSGNFLMAWGSQGSGEGEFRYPTDVAVDAAGNVYVTDRTNYCIQKFDSSGKYLMKWGSIGSIYPTSIAVDSNDNVYVFDRDSIQKFDDSGNFIATWGSTGIEDGEFLSHSSATGIAVDASDNIYVIDSGNHRIQKFDSSGNFSGKLESKIPGDKEFLRPSGIGLDSAGNVYVADRDNYRVQKFDDSSNYLSTVGSLGFGDGEFQSEVRDVAIDASGNIYVLNGNIINKFDDSGNFLTKWGSHGTGDGETQWAWGITSDLAGDIYIADTDNHRIQKFDSSGKFLAKFGSYGSGNGEFREPGDVAVDSSGNIYVADTYNHRIQKFDDSGEFLTTWGLYGSGDGEFRRPWGIAVDATGDVYVADTDNRRIQKFDGSGSLLTEWGSQTSGKGKISAPWGIAIDASGNVYVVEFSGRVQKFAPVSLAAFTTNTTAGPAPLAVQFNDTSTENPTAWSWDFGDGNTSTVQNPTHTYTVPGTYTVNLTVTNTAGSSSATATITVTDAAACDLTIGGVPNPIGGVVFAREPNTIRVTNIRNNGPGASPATVLEVRSDDGWAGRVDIPPIEPGKNIVSISIEDPTIRNLAGGTVTYTAEIDPDNTVIETDETNNIRTSPPKAVKYNGYKGKRYWEGGSDITTVRTYDLRGGIMHSFGDSRYVPGSSGSGEPWTSYTVTWTADDLPLPASASVRDAWLYVPYSWDNNGTVPDGVSIDFNGVRVPYENWYTDVSNFGPYVDHHYGLLTYNVTSLFQKDTDNTALFERDRPGKISPAGFTLAVVYEDASATRKQIFVNEEFDLLGADPAGYGTNETEATAYVPFSGMTIDTGNAVRADLTTFVPWGDCGDGTRPGEGNLLFNDELIQEWVWDYGEGDSTQVAVDERDLRGRLRPTGNVAGIQGTEANSPTMVAAQVFL